MHRPRYMRTYMHNCKHSYVRAMDLLNEGLKAAAASIWFETWGVVDPGQQNLDFSRQISEKFRFFQAISRKISTFPGKFMKNFNF